MRFQHQKLICLLASAMTLSLANGVQAAKGGVKKDVQGQKDPKTQKSETGKAGGNDTEDTEDTAEEEAVKKNSFESILVADALKLPMSHGLVLVIHPSNGEMSVVSKTQADAQTPTSAQYCLDTTALGQLQQILKDGAACLKGQDCQQFEKELRDWLKKMKANLMQYQCGSAPQPTPVPTPVATPNPTPVPTPDATPTATPVATPVATPTPVPSNATFSYIRSNVLIPHCVSCHGGAGGYSYDSYTATLKSVSPNTANSSPLYTSIKSGRMPIGNGSISAADLQAIYDWIQAGAPNN